MSDIEIEEDNQIPVRKGFNNRDGHVFALHKNILNAVGTIYMIIYDYNKFLLFLVSSCAFGQVVDDLLVVRDIFSGGDDETEPVKMGKYSKRILVSLGLVVIASQGSLSHYFINKNIF